MGEEKSECSNFFIVVVRSMGILREHLSEHWGIFVMKLDLPLPSDAI